MRLDASSAPACLSVGRRFERHRLAGDCQARAYEQVLPLAGRTAVVASGRTDGSRGEGERIEIPSLMEIPSLTEERFRAEQRTSDSQVSLARESSAGEGAAA